VAGGLLHAGGRHRTPHPLRTIPEERMKVTSGASWRTEAGNSRSYAIEMEEIDLLRTGMSNADLMAMTNRHIRARLTAMADISVIEYMHKNGALTATFAEQRILEVSMRLKEELSA
jgi:hypothetical protein